MCTIVHMLGQKKSAEVIAPAEMEEREKALLTLSKEMSAKLPFNEIDVLFIDEMGKEISGCGYDSKIVGRIGLPMVTPDPWRRKVRLV